MVIQGGNKVIIQLFDLCNTLDQQQLWHIEHCTISTVTLSTIIATVVFSLHVPEVAHTVSKPSASAVCLVTRERGGGGGDVQVQVKGWGHMSGRALMGSQRDRG
jgi:hypothetical protein